MESRQLLLYAQRLQAISQAGLTYAFSVYDQERYDEIRAISVQLLGELTEEPFEKIIRVFASEEGYQTPKVDIRAMVVRDVHQILLVSEKGDQGRWTLPGGWADVGYTPFEIAAKEVYEETGLIVRPVRLLALLDFSKPAAKLSRAVPRAASSHVASASRLRSRKMLKNLVASCAILPNSGDLRYASFNMSLAEGAALRMSQTICRGEAPRAGRWGGPAALVRCPHRMYLLLSVQAIQQSKS